MKYKILIVTGTRAEYGLFRSTILKLHKSKFLDVKLLVTGMHTLKKFGYSLDLIKKDMSIDCVVQIQEDESMILTLNREIEGMYHYIDKNNFDAILVVGDRGESFAAAIVGIHLNIPIIHVSGGDISGLSVDHFLRNAITIFSKLHLVQTRKSKENVIKLGVNPKNVFVVGSCGLDNLHIKNLISRNELAKKLRIKCDSRWFLISMHPTPFEKISFIDQINPIIEALKKLKSDDEKIIIYPNSDTGNEIFINALVKLSSNNPNFHLYKNIDRNNYLSLLYQSKMLIGNSSSGLMEAGYLKKPFINIGNRQRGREKGVNVIPVDYDYDQILKGISIALSERFNKKIRMAPAVYLGGSVSDKIVERIEFFLKGNYA